MNVLLTGGYGCIGSWIAKNLLARGDRVWVYDLKEDPKRMRLIMSEPDVKKVAFVEGDVENTMLLTDVGAARGGVLQQEVVERRPRHLPCSRHPDARRDVQGPGAGLLQPRPHYADDLTIGAHGATSRKAGRASASRAARSPRIAWNRRDRTVPIGTPRISATWSSGRSR